MLYTICRCARPRLRHFVQLFLLIGCCLPLGCGDGEERTEQKRTKQDHTKQKITKHEPPVQERLISVKLTGRTKTQKVACGSYQRGEIFAGIRAEEAIKAGKDRYEFLTSAGELLMVELPGKVSKSKDWMRFAYVFRGDEKTPLVFSRRPGLGMLNGEVICVDLGSKAGAQWFAQQPDAQLKTIRTLLLSDDAATDTAALGRMAGSGIAIVSVNKTEDNSTKPASAVEAKVIRAIIAAKPACLFTDRIEINENMIGQLPDLTHLIIPGSEIPDLTKLKKLRFLGCFDEVTTLAPLAKLTRLRGLSMRECDSVTDFSPLRKLTRLRTLHIGIGAAGKLTDLDFLTDLRELRSLTLGLDVAAKIKSIAPIGKLTNLTELAIIPMPPTVKDLDPLKKLKNLKMIVVNNDSLEKRQKEYDEIRKALPDCKIMGFCMGSAWILLVVPVAMGLGVWWRRRSATPKAA